MDDKKSKLRKFVAPEFIFGEGSLNLVGRYASNFGAGNALIVTDPGVIRAGWTSKVEKCLSENNISYQVFSEVTPNPKDYEVMKGVELYDSKNCDIIIAVGGGSPMDCAKGIGISSSNKKNVLEFEGVDEVEIPGPPLICIPTTAGTSADVSQFAIVSDTKRKVKIAIISKTVVPDLSLIDPVATTTMSSELTAATGMDALVHAFEAYVSNASSKFTDLNAIAAIDLIWNNLPEVLDKPEEFEYRKEMMMGSLLAGLAFSNASLGLVHAMAHSLGGYSDLAHGDCNSILLEHIVDYNYKAAPARYDEILSVIDKDYIQKKRELNKSHLIELIKKFRKSVGITQTLLDLGVTEKEVPKLAENAFNDPCLATNPISPSLEDITTIYEKAL